MRWLGLVAMALGCAPEEKPCRMVDSLDDLAGQGAIACGSFGAGEDPTEGWACAVDAYRSHSAFVLDYADGITGSSVHHGLASDGFRTFFLYQGEDRGVLRDVDGRECLAPVVADQTGGAEILDCEEYKPADRVWQFCTTVPDETDQIPFPG